MRRPLEGLKVVELGTHVAVPKVARFFADWGADVIKVEPPKGEPLRTVGPAYEMPCSPDNNPIFQVENINKRSIFINLKSEDGKKVMHKLLETADVFVTNTRPRALSKLGFDYDSLKERYPKLVYGHLSAYGEKGPEKDAAGFDKAAFWAKGGIPMAWQIGDHPPFLATPGAGDSTTGGFLLTGILAALFAREKTGKGDFVQTSLYSSALWINSIGVLNGQSRYGLEFPKKIPVDPLCPPYRTKDGDWMMVASPIWDGFYEKVFPLIGLEKYVGDSKFQPRDNVNTNNEFVCSLIAEAFVAHTTKELKKIFAENDIINSVYMNPKNICTDEQALANNFLGTITLENGDDVMVPRVPIIFRSVENPELHLAPRIGEHSIEIMKEIGMSDKEITKVIESKSVVAK